jgi:hypothetical protein
MNAVNQRTCPLCGGDNQCAIASGSDPRDCWCREAAIDTAVLARLPAEAVGKVCICPACAGTGGEHVVER